MKQADNHFVFFRALPTTFKVVSNVYSNYTTEDVKSRTEIRSATLVRNNSVLNDHVREYCACGKYCWSDPHAPWVNHTQKIRHIMQEALKSHIEANSTLVEVGTIIKDGDVSTAERGTFLPIVPDAAIHYRCGDTVPSTVYGFLPFKAIKDLVPSDSKYIYVLTDPPARASVMGGLDRFASNCLPILLALHSYLHTSFPGATVIVKRGGDPFVDYYRLSRARVTICSVSTFCLWPAIASTNVAHFPVSPLVAGNSTPFLGHQFKWITKPLIITDFQADTPLDAVLARLKSEV